MLIKRVKKTSLYDIFMKDGWEHWSRYYLDDVKYTHLGGDVLPRYLIELARKERNK